MRKSVGSSAKKLSIKDSFRINSSKLMSPTEGKQQKKHTRFKSTILSEEKLVELRDFQEVSSDFNQLGLQYQEEIAKTIETKSKLMA